MTILSNTVRELMSQAPLLIEAERSLNEAAEKMADAGLHCLLVSPQEKGGCYGIITCKDVVQVLADSNQEVLGELRVEDVMTTPAISVEAGIGIRDAIRLMRMVGVRRAPVMDQGKLCGVLSYTDVLRTIAQQQKAFADKSAKAG